MAWLGLQGLLAPGISENAKAITESDFLRESQFGDGGLVELRRLKERNFGKTQSLSILQGATDDTTTQMTILAPKGKVLQLNVFELGPSISAQNVFCSTHANDLDLLSVPTIELRPPLEIDGIGWQIHKVKISQLRFGPTYRMEVRSGIELLDVRSFQTLDPEKKEARFVVLSCIHDVVYNEGNWDALYESKPDVVFLVGDSSYIDYISWFKRKPANLRQAWTRHIDTRLTVKFYFQEKLIPMLAVWDDHDYGFNNAGRDFEFKNETLQAFRSFFAQDEDNKMFKKGPILASAFFYAGQNFVLLENRWNRISKTSPEPGFFGPSQKSWCLEVLEDQKRPTWLMQGSVWFGAYHNIGNDSYEYLCPSIMTQFLERIKLTGTRVALVSGDVHYTEVQKIESSVLGYETLEITSSSMHSWTSPGWSGIHVNKRRVEATSKHNFVLIESKVSLKGGMQGEIVSLASGPAEIFKMPFEIG